MSDKPRGEIQPVATGPMAVVEPPANDITALLSQAVDKGIDADAMEKLLTLHERVADRMAAQEFARAMAQFKDECPTIARKTKADIITKSGSRFAYHYADLPEIARAIDPVLRRCGLSYTWDSKVEGTILACVCTIRHVGGHSSDSLFSCPTTTTAGMSDQQKYGSAFSYAQRQSLKGALGLTTCDPDDDGAGGTAAFQPIAPDQVASLRTAIEDTDSSMNGFLSYFHIEKLEALPVDRLDEATRMLAEKWKRLAAKDAEGAQP